MKLQRSPLAALLYSLVVGIAPLARAACECGYLDPATNALWTDATITYFNETGLTDVVTNPAVSPGIYGMETSGSTGQGQESWVIVGDHVNVWEDSFGATYRSAVSYNNTYLQDQTQGLSMQVSLPNPKTRIVNGSQIVTRRRDIQYGSFRAAIAPAEMNGQGAGFKFGVSYNESETVDTTIYVSNDATNASVAWSYSATMQDSHPHKFNYSWLNVDPTAPLEHRMDWLNHKSIQFRNSGLNDTVAFGEYVKHANATNIPTMPAPVSFQAWANGEPTGSQGPPTFSPLVTRIVYTRFFFNSTMVQRHDEFAAQCKAASAPVCSTEDYELRNSTVFSLAALDHIKEAKIPFHAPLYAIIAESCFLAIAIAVFVHGVFIRRKKDAAKKAAAASVSGGDHKHDDMSEYSTEHSSSQVEFIDNQMVFKSSPSSSIPELPDFSHGWDTDSDYDSDEMDEDEEPVVTGDIEARRKSIRFSVAEKLPMYHAKMDEIASPRPALNTQDSFRLDASTLGLFTPPEVKEEPKYINDPTRRRSSMRRGSTLRRESKKSVRMSQYTTHSSAAQFRTLQLQPEPAIVKWGKRHGGDEVGQLAKPRHSIAVSSRRQSTIFVRDTFIQSIFNRLRDAIFISGPGQKTSVGDRRIDYLDGMRGFACLFVSVGHFILMFYPGIANVGAPRHYPVMEQWVRSVLGPIIIDAPLVLGIFFMLPARTVCQRYLLKGGLLSLADSTVRRLPRLILPVAGACLANYLMIDVNAYKWVQRLASRSWSTWAFYQNYDNVLTFLNAFISLWWATPPASPAMVTGYATGVLWTIPLIMQGMWTCTVTTLIAHEFKTTWKRFVFYACCIGLSWYADTWDMFFMGGLVIADLDANLKYREKAAKGIPLYIIPKIRIPGVWLAWVVMLGAGSLQWLSIDVRATLGLPQKEYGIHPDWQTSDPHNWSNGFITYVNPEPLAWFWIMSLFVLADLSSVFQVFFRLRLWSFLGRHSMAYFLCHGIIFWTWGAWLCLALLKAGASYWAAVLVTFITSYFWLTILCVCFTYTFEAWATSLAKATWRAASGKLGQK